MSNPNSQVSNYIDLLIVETLLGNTGLSKMAQGGGIASEIITKVQSYIGNHIDPNDKAGSIFNMLGPGLISGLFSLLGFGKIGILIGYAASALGLDFDGIGRSILSGLKEELGGGKQTTSERVDNIVQSAVQQNSSPGTAEETSSADDANLIVARHLRMAKILSLASNNSDKLFSYGRPTVSWLSRILKFVFRVIISAAGLMVAGDLTNHLLGRPNAIDNTIRDGKPVEQGASAAVTDVSHQLRFPLNVANQSSSNTVRNSSSINWIENVPNNEGSISQMLQNFAKEVYSNLDGHESAIQASPYFNNIVETIVWYNHEHPGSPIIYIPRSFTTKKQLVDQFIDDVAQKTPATPQQGDMKTYKV